MAFTLATDAEYGGIAFSPDDRRLAYWTLRQTIKVRDLATGNELHALPGPAGYGLYPVWSPDGKHLACSGDDGSIWLYDAEKGARVRNLERLFLRPWIGPYITRSHGWWCDECPGMDGMSQ